MAGRRAAGEGVEAAAALATNLRAVAHGVILALAVAPVAALGATDGLGAAAALGEVALLPALMFLQGFAFAGDPHRVRRALRLGLLGAAAAAVAVATGLALHLPWQEGLALAGPALRLLLLPAPYMAALALLRKGPPSLVIFVAVLLHIAGVVIGGSAAADLSLLPYFALGAILARSGDRLPALIAAEPEYAAASGPVLVALTLVLGSRALGPTSLAALGPLVLPLGLLAGPVALAAAHSVAQTPAAPYLARFGRMAPALAIAWLPVFHFSLAIARRGGAPTPASLVLLSASALLLAVLAADVFAPDEPSGGGARWPAVGKA